MVFFIKKNPPEKGGGGWGNPAPLATPLHPDAILCKNCVYSIISGLMGSCSLIVSLWLGMSRVI